MATKRRQSAPFGIVYFMEAWGKGRIKIGYTERWPTDRLRQIQRQTGDRMHLLGFVIGTMKTETLLHHCFGREWLYGEMFRDDGVIRRFIAGYGVVWPYSVPEWEPGFLEGLDLAAFCLAHKVMHETLENPDKPFEDIARDTGVPVEKVPDLRVLGACLWRYNRA
jgi:hypothetical protein